ncbi:hypothetical protein ACWEQ1_30210 [Streptomyces nodosus]
MVSVPSWQRFAVHRYKPLLVDAVGQVLPARHRARASKGISAGDFHRGVRANLRRLSSLAGGRLAGLGLIAPEPLREALRCRCRFRVGRAESECSKAVRLESGTASLVPLPGPRGRLGFRGV